jgi:hypothetical protein
VLIPDPQPRHPWLDHVWIFPEDHPLAALERAEYYKQNPKRKQFPTLERPPRQLPPGREDDSRI